ncbi:uncharacterized protein LOC106141224 [Amyelois transitella]|uniref:uncharacterized protein LOC106141224 n=1 Tax=Amyelois transitella TaxID=680683 RepID=UPI00298F90DF|nr:uncharacterized protein LOC106141224 [Amyelois transitella]
MVIVTRSAYKKASESLSSSDISCKNIIPPWCSSGKVSVQRKSRKATSPWEVQSSYPLRENIWQFLYEDRERNCACKRTKRVGQRRKHKRCGKTAVIMCTFLLITVFMLGSLWITNSIPKLGELTKLLQYDTFSPLFTYCIMFCCLISVWLCRELAKCIIYSVAPEAVAAVDEECCYRMKYLAAELSRVEKTLRHTLRLRKAVMLTSQSIKTDSRLTDGEYIQASAVTIGRNTIEWGGLLALWGIVPLWRAARPPHTILALRRPAPADCWPFSGSQGEVIVDLPGIHQVWRVSIEHVRPDAAKSAPRHFVIYGISANNTWTRAINGEYKNAGPPKQYYAMKHDIPFRQIAFRVLSNQGNPKYTCLYRFHVHGVKDNSILSLEME